MDDFSYEIIFNVLYQRYKYYFFLNIFFRRDYIRSHVRYNNIKQCIEIILLLKIKYLILL